MRPEDLMELTGFTARAELNGVARLPITLFLSFASVLISSFRGEAPGPQRRRPEAGSTFKAYNGLTEKPGNQAVFDILFTFYDSSGTARRRLTCTLPE